VEYKERFYIGVYLFFCFSPKRYLIAKLGTGKE